MEFNSTRTSAAQIAAGFQEGSSWVPLLAFTAIFPGFFIYHELVAAGYIEPVLRGYFTASMAIALPILGISYIREWRSRDQYFTVDAIFFVFLIYFGIVVLAHLLVGVNQPIAKVQLAVVVQFLALFLVFRLIDPMHARFQLLCRLSFVVMTAILVSNTSDGAIVISNVDLASSGYSTPTYQDFAFVYTLTTLILVAYLRSGWSRWFVYVVAFAVQFLNGARSEFIGFLLAVMIMEFCLIRRRIVLVLIMAGISASAAAVLGKLVAMLPSNRIVDLIESGARGSLDERREMQAAALRTLANNPVLGDFGSYEPGEYAHNLLSVWVDLGVFGFLLYVALLLVPMRDLLDMFKARSRDPSYVLILAVYVLTVPLVLVAKNFTYGMFPIVLALYARDKALRASTTQAVTSARCSPGRAPESE